MGSLERCVGDLRRQVEARRRRVLGVLAALQLLLPILHSHLVRRRARGVCIACQPKPCFTTSHRPRNCPSCKRAIDLISSRSHLLALFYSQWLAQGVSSTLRRRCTRFNLTHSCDPFRLLFYNAYIPPVAHFLNTESSSLSFSSVSRFTLDSPSSSSPSSSSLSPFSKSHLPSPCSLSRVAMWHGI